MELTRNPIYIVFFIAKNVGFSVSPHFFWDPTGILFSYRRLVADAGRRLRDALLGIPPGLPRCLVSRGRESEGAAQPRRSRRILEWSLRTVDNGH